MANKHIKKHLDRLLSANGKLLKVTLSDSDRYVFFSDLHRGLGDVADDFTDENKKSYRTALRYYYEKGYTLVLLGDVEELEEQQDIQKVMDYNIRSVKIEQLFYKTGRLIKCFGNHDDKWEDLDKVKKFLHPLFSDIVVYEGINFEYKKVNSILAVHGHQGALGSDILPFLEYLLPVYRFYLNLRGKNRYNEYKNVCEVGKREQDLHDWVSERPNSLILCGHTHRPVWGSRLHAEKLSNEIEILRDKISEIAKEHNTALSEVINKPDQYAMVDTVNTLQDTIGKFNQKVKNNGMCSVDKKELPRLFNTGCCIYSDGDITGIEIVDGRMKLIKWDYNSDQPQRIVLEEDSLDGLFAKAKASSVY